MADNIVKEALEFFQESQEHSSFDRAEAINDLKFGYGDQWTTAMQQQRTIDQRPFFVINETDSYIRQIVNGIRQQRPRIVVHGTNSQASADIAKVLTGITRHIEVNSDADNAYDSAAEYAVRIGFGYWRLRTDYVRPDSFEQEIFIDSIYNPFSVSFDAHSVLPDGSDSERCIISENITKDEFKRQYPGADMTSFEGSSLGNLDAEWVDKETLRLGEFYRIEQSKQRLYQLSDGTTRWEDKMPDPAVLAAVGVKVTSDRDSWRKQVKWYKLNAYETLATVDIPGIYIPVVPCYGAHVLIDGKTRRFGAIRAARDPQTLINVWQTNITESIAMAPKAKWMIEEGSDEGHEVEWANANVSAQAVLRYKRTNIDGQPANPPQRIQPEPSPEGAIAAAMSASQNLQRVMGMFDPSIRQTGPTSGKALNAEQQQSDNSNYHFYDNLTRSIKHTGRIILGWIPEYYPEQRVMRIIGDDGKPDMVTINDRTAVGKVENDITIGQYDVIMETGPGYNSKRQEALAGFTQLLGGPLGEEVAKIGGDVVVRMFDSPGMDTLADRMAAANPLSKIDENSEIPPQAQMLITQLQTQLQQAGQQMDAMAKELKYRGELEKFKQGEETKREHMRAVVKAHDTETWAKEERDQFESVERTKIHDTTMRAVNAMDIEELKGHFAILLKRMEESGEKSREAAE